ncbi:hypothetical protein HYH03_002679 [Edaphochlamys debaryana]|uniref:J domain-containing protein n=1 Tax=Edaphochlamys debaryana TaxID=47281 RepID=A0A835YF48_9CHLO|nr:hypothetical protein HYH03_002679 [Edaphochlamys debaryana]|eukprot:KAG2499746.1 hypothetical protein HYH03_002679 [Edaphochlamys debaryana]
MQASFSGRSHVSHPASAPGRARTGRLTTVKVVGQQYDASLRVRGTFRKVFKYAADFEHLPDWYPGVTSVQRLRGEPGKGAQLKNVYRVERNIMNMQHTSTYEVVEFVPGRKVVYSAISPLHTAVHMLHVMGDPTDKNYTNIRYQKKIQLRNIAGALQPLVSGTLSKIPEQGLQNLAKLLISPNTPLKDIKLDPAEEAEEARELRPQSGWSWQSVWDGLGLGSAPSGYGSSGSVLSSVDQQADSLGYYAILGLDIKRTAQYSMDDIKAAYRSKAMELHPDRVSVDDSTMQETATQNFQRLQKAYNVLKNPDHKALYDQGKLLEESAAV